MNARSNVEANAVPAQRLDNETFLYRAGVFIAEKRNLVGREMLSPLERLIHGFWVVDHAIRNTFDAAFTADFVTEQLAEARIAAEQLGLPCSAAAFALSVADLQEQYFDLFDGIAAEIRSWNSKQALQ